MVWHGDLELRGRIALRNRHGLSFVLVFNDIPQQPQHPPKTSSEIWPEESDDESLLQLRGSPSTAAHSTQNGGLDCWWHWKQLLAESTGSWTSRRSRTTRTRAWLPASNIIWLLRSTRLVQFWSWSPDNTIWSTTPVRKPSTRPSPIRDQTTDYDPGAGSLWSFVDLHRRILYTSHEENDAGKSRWTRASWHLGVCRRCWELWNHAAFQTYGSWLDCPTSPLWPKWIFICWDNQNWIRHGRKICSDWCGHVEIVSEPWHHYSLLFRLSTRRRTSCRQFGHGSSRWIIQATPQSFSSTRTCTSWGLIFIMSELMLGSCSLRLPTSQQNRKHNNLSIFLDKALTGPDGRFIFNNCGPFWRSTWTTIMATWLYGYQTTRSTTMPDATMAWRAAALSSHDTQLCVLFWDCQRSIVPWTTRAWRETALFATTNAHVQFQLPGHTGREVWSWHVDSQQHTTNQYRFTWGQLWQWDLVRPWHALWEHPSWPTLAVLQGSFSSCTCRFEASTSSMWYWTFLLLGPGWSCTSWRTHTGG